MDEAELRKVNRQLDRLDDRVRKVIARQTPLKLDRSLPKGATKSAKPAIRTEGAHEHLRPRRLAQDPGYSPRPVVASGQLSGHELSFYEPPACREEHQGFDYTRDVVFAEFNEMIDELAAASRKSGC